MRVLEGKSTIKKKKWRFIAFFRDFGRVVSFWGCNFAAWKSQLTFGFEFERRGSGSSENIEQFKICTIKKENMSKFLTLMLAVMTFAACTNTNEKMNNCENDTWDKLAEFFNKNLK